MNRRKFLKDVFLWTTGMSLAVPCFDITKMAVAENSSNPLVSVAKGTDYKALVKKVLDPLNGLNSLFPAFNDAASSFFTMTYKFGPDWLNMVTEPIYSVLKETVLPFKQKYYSLSLISLFLLLIIFFLEKYGRRFFCNKICPLGAFLSLVSRFTFLRGFRDLNSCIFQVKSVPLC